MEVREIRNKLKERVSAYIEKVENGWYEAEPNNGEKADHEKTISTLALAVIAIDLGDIMERIELWEDE